MNGKVLKPVRKGCGQQGLYKQLVQMMTSLLRFVDVMATSTSTGVEQSVALPPAGP